MKENDHHTQRKRIPDPDRLPEIFSCSLQFFLINDAIFTAMLGSVKRFIGSLGDRVDGIRFLQAADTDTDGHRQRRTVRYVIQVIAGRSNGFADVLGPFDRVF